MQKLKFNFETETTVTVSHYNELWRAKPTIGQLAGAYDSLLSDIDDLAEDSDPDISNELIALSLIRPPFEQLTIENIQTADYDQIETGWDHIFLIRFSFTIDQRPYEALYNLTFNL